MKQYIEKEAIEYPYMTMTLWGLNAATCHAYNEGVKATADAIAAIPAADVVEVVRCKDCERQQLCRLAQRLGDMGYCSEGERRGDNG